MKKLALLIVLMMVIALTTYAEGGATVTVTGAVKVQWGMDIDNLTTGFKYVMDGLQVVMKPPVEKSEAKKTGAEGETVYGEIAMAGLRLEADSGWNGMTNYSSVALIAKWDKLTAKVVLGPLTIQLRDGASTDINYEGDKTDSYWLTNAYDYLVFSNRYGANDSAQSAALANGWESWNQIQFNTPGHWYKQPIDVGVTAKFSVPSMVDLVLDIASYDAWDAAAAFDAVADNDNAYCGRFSATVTAVPDLTLALGANFGFGYTAAVAVPTAFGGKVGYAVKLAEDMKITPAVATDIILPDSNDTEPRTIISVTGGVKAEMFKSTLTANVGIDLDSSTLAYTIAAVIGAIDGLTLNAAYEAYDPDTAAAADDTMAVHVKLGYAIKIDKITVTPTVQMSMDNKADLATDLADDTAQDLFAKFQLEIAGLVPNTQFFLNWNSNDLNNTTADIDKMGEFVVTTRIAF